jgi:hypothetical protein
MTFAEFLGYAGSVSYLRNVIRRGSWAAFEDELRALLVAHFGQGPCQVPLRIDVVWAFRRVD